MFSAFTASSKVIVIICGTSDAVKFPGTSVPSFEHQQSGARQFLGSQGVALFGSFRASMKPVKKKILIASKHPTVFEFLTAPHFVGAIRTVDASVAKVCSREARAVSASQKLLIAVALLEKRSRWLRLCKTLKEFPITTRDESIQSVRV